jgi:hypothetical protein
MDSIFATREMEVRAHARSPAVTAAVGHRPRARAAAPALAEPDPPEGSADAAPRGGRRWGLRVRGWAEEAGAVERSER